MVSIEINPDFGYVIITVVVTVFLLVVMGGKVGAARKKYGVKYPTMYSDSSNVFNCIQRVHQNTLENIPTFLVLLLLGGIYSPKASAVGGAIWLLGRVFYARGYYTGEPAKRNQGAFGYIGLITLLVNTIRFAVNLLYV